VERRKRRQVARDGEEEDAQQEDLHLPLVDLQGTACLGGVPPSRADDPKLQNAARQKEINEDIGLGGGDPIPPEEMTDGQLTSATGTVHSGEFPNQATASYKGGESHRYSANDDQEQGKGANFHGTKQCDPTCQPNSSIRRDPLSSD